MKPRIVSGILVTLLLTSFVITTVNVTGVFALSNNSTNTNTQKSPNNILNSVDFNKTQSATDPTPKSSSNFMDLNAKKQKSTSSGNWGSDSNEFVIGVSEGWQSYGKVEQFALSRNAKIINKVVMGNRMEAVVVTVPQNSVTSFMNDIRNAGLSTYIEPRIVYQASMIPNDQYWSVQWGPAKIQADLAWNITTGSKSVLVAVVDTGVDYNHPDLTANYWPGGYDWVNNDTDPMDDMGHGTHVAGIIGAVINNGIGIAGLAQVRIMAEKGLDAGGSGYDDVLAQAIIHATDQNATIINMSWGGSTPTTLIEDALKYAYDHGVLLVAAAGNSASSAKLYPAAYDEVIAVTATDSNDQPATFTSYGDWVEVAAPGVSILSTISSIHDPRFNSPYDYLSGTSMACPHVVGVAALVWSRFPTMSRDVLRFHLLDTADDLGAPGFDIYYGYGRINALKALTQPLPPHEVVIASMSKPPYVEPNATATVNATIINYGSHDETNVKVGFIVNGTVKNSLIIQNFLSGTSDRLSFSWTPTTVGNYNVTIYAAPVSGETNTQNNVAQGFVYVGTPLRAFVLRSAGTQMVVDAWNTLNYNWQRYGNRLVYIDYTTLNKDNISYADLNATKADVLILSCAYLWQYTDAEIDAIKQYVYEGHGFIATAGSFYYYVPNNNKFLPLLGLNESTTYSETSTDFLSFLKPSHLLFTGVPNPYTMPTVGTGSPEDGVWSSNELAGGTYVAMGYYNESTIVTYRGLVYISPWLEAIPEHYEFNLQLLYNAITWSQYQKPLHELTTKLEAPANLFSNRTEIINATVTNNGALTESYVDFQLSIYDLTRHTPVILLHEYGFSLASGAFHSLNYSWNPTLSGQYNVTAYAQPVPGEENTADNKVTVLVTSAQPIINPVEGTWTHYGLYNAGNGSAPVQSGEMQFVYYRYISPYQINVTLWQIVYGQGGMFSAWTIVNIFNRMCEDGVWQGLWFPMLVQTNITAIGEQVNILPGPATVDASETLVINSRMVNCWRLYQPYYSGVYYYWYDKTTGVLVKLDYFAPGQPEQLLILDGTNLSIGSVPEHELKVTANAPILLQFGTPAVLSAGVSNFGTHNETSVGLELQVNGTTVNSASFDLTVNASEMIFYDWTPPNPGVYNITAYSPPVTGENITSDNVATTWVSVVAVRGRVLFDQGHANDYVGPYSSYSVWISSLRDEGFIVDTTYAPEINSTILAGYDAFVTVQAYRPYNNSEITAIQQFVANGGGLLVVGDDYPGIYTNLTGFAGISWVSGGVSCITNNIFPHKVTQGVHNVFINFPVAQLLLSSRAQWLVNDTSSEIMLAVNWYQQGRVMGFADEDSLRDYVMYLNGTDNLRLAVNMVAWLCERDTAPPEMTSITPANGTLIGTTSLELKWNTNDLQSGIDYCSVYRNGELVDNTTARAFTLSGLTEGANNLTVVAYDFAQNHASLSVSIIVDTTPPTLQINTPGNNSYARQVVAVNFSGVDAHFSHTDLYVDTRLVASYNTSEEQTYSWNTLVEQDGIHDITLIGYDSVGNGASISISVNVDNISPTAIIVSPTNETYVRGYISMAFIAQDGALKNASIKIDDANSTDVTGRNSAGLDTVTLADGTHTMRLEVYDMAGNKAETSVIIIVDNKIPDAQISSPINNTFVRGLVGIGSSYDDPNFAYAVLSVDGRTIETVVGSGTLGQATGSVHSTWDTAMEIDGVHTLMLTVSDYAENTKTVTIRVFVDNTSPVGEIRSPLRSTDVKGTVDIAFYGYDANLNNMTLLIDQGSLLHYWNSSGTHDRSWDTSAITDGLHTITLTVYDKAGNQLTTSIEVNVDNTAPTVSIISPEDGKQVSGMVTINYTADDATTFSLVLFIDNAQIILSPQTAYQWDTTKVVDGNHTISITATDIAGNAETQTITVMTANATPTYMTYIGYASAGILGLMLGAIAVWALLKRRPLSKSAA